MGAGGLDTKARESYSKESSWLPLSRAEEAWSPFPKGKLIQEAWIQDKGEEKGKLFQFL